MKEDPDPLFMELNEAFDQRDAAFNPSSPRSRTKIADFMKNHPSVIKKLRILINQHQQEHPESTGWSLQQAQHALVKLDAPLSEHDAHAMFTYIDQHGNSDGVLQYADFDGLMAVLQTADAPTADVVQTKIADEISNALKGFDPEDNKRLHAAAHNTIEQLSGNTSSGHVVYRTTEGAPLVYSLISFGIVGDLLLSAVKGLEDPTARLDIVMAQQVEQQNGSPVTWLEVATNGRGVEGETVLHICTLLGTDDHVKVVRYLLGKIGTERNAMEGGRRLKFVDTSYTGSLYRGEVALHIAAVKNNHRIAKMLIEGRASVNRPFANGDFFKSSSLHYGGSILGFACVNSDFALFEMLVEAGASIDVVDEYGNSLLHLCVVHKRYHQFAYLIAIHKTKLGKYLHIPNAHGFTPLLLAALTRDYKMFEQVEKSCREVIWEFGNVVSYKVTLDFIDSLSAHRLGYKSLLELLVEENITECTTPLIELLINDKWEAYGRTAYYFKLVLFILDLVLLSLSIHGEIDMLWSFLSVLVVHIGESVVTLGYVIFHSSDLAAGLAISEFKEQLSEELLPMSYSGLVIAAYVTNKVCSLDECPEFQIISASESYKHCFCKESSVLLGLASILGWTHLLKYLKGTKLGGVSVVMLQRMLQNDTVKWSVLYLCVIIGFTEALWANTSRSEQFTESDNYTEKFISMFRTTLADGFLYESIKEEALLEWVAVLLWVMFIFLSAVVLMNMLIAMMGETYSIQRDNAQLTWKLLRASIILESERSIMAKLLEWWHCKPLYEVRPHHHVLGTEEKMSRDGTYMCIYALVVEEELDQNNDLQASWEEANTNYTRRHSAAQEDNASN